MEETQDNQQRRGSGEEAQEHLPEIQSRVQLLREWRLYEQGKICITGKEQVGAIESRPGGGLQMLFEKFDDSWVLDTRPLP